MTRYFISIFQTGWFCLLLLLSACTGQKKYQETGLSYEQQRRFNHLYLESECQRLKGNEAAQYELLQAALAIHPEAPEALYAMGRLKISMGSDDVLEGEELLKKALQLNPDELLFSQTLTEHYIENGHFEAALPFLEGIVQKKETPENLTLLSHLYVELEMLDQAMDAIHRLEKLEGRSHETAMAKFELHLLKNDTIAAYEEIEKLCQEYPNEMEHRVNKANLYHQNGHFADARAEYQKILEKEPHNGFAMYSCMIHYKELKEDSLYEDMLQQLLLKSDANTALKAAILKDYTRKQMQTKGDTIALFNLFEQTLEQPQDDASLAQTYVYTLFGLESKGERMKKALEKLLLLDPENIEARFELMKYAVEKEDYWKIANLSIEGTKTNPEILEFYYWGAVSCITLQRYDDALELLRPFPAIVEKKKNEWEKSGQLLSEIFSISGDLLHENGEIEEAYKAYERSLVWNPKNLGCLNNYAYFLCLENKELEKAEKMSQQTVEAEPKNAVYLDTYAWILYNMERYTQAGIFIEQALKYTEDTEENATYYDHAGDIFFQCGEKNRALENWKKALKLTQDESLKKTLQTKIKNKKTL